ncbi:Lrp/AsnC family transcriptional regulator [Candidatus Woesearchaeota archaeon]|nr:Lrp/AsnC family transcriptional regulator [Candidatus Woesearchaeota archaeon]
MTGRIDYELVQKKVKLDIKDRKILSLLADNSRMPLTEIAKKVQLSRDSINYRIKRLQKEGVILKFFSQLNYSKLGFKKFIIYLLVDESDKKAQQELLKFLEAHPNVFSIIEYSAQWDYEVRLIARDVFEFDRISLDIASRFPKLILEKDRSVILRKYKAKYLPPIIDERKFKVTAEEKLSTEKLDDIDLKILKLLSEDCRISTYEISNKVKISPDTASYRIKNLVKKEIIRKFTLLINFSALNYNFYSFCFNVKKFDKNNEAMFEEFVQQHPNILRAEKTLGDWDLVLHVLAKTTKEYHYLVKEIKNVFSDIVYNYQTWIAFKEHIFKTMPEAVK